MRFKDLTGPAVYDRDGNELMARGLYLDLSPWSYHVFEVIAFVKGYGRHTQNKESLTAS